MVGNVLSVMLSIILLTSSSIDDLKRKRKRTKGLTNLAMTLVVASIVSGLAYSYGGESAAGYGMIAGVIAGIALKRSSKWNVFLHHKIDKFGKNVA
jgi:hypothetical protein